MSYKFLSTILGIDANFTGLVGIGTTNPYGDLEVTSKNKPWGEGIVVNPSPSGYEAIFFRVEGTSGSSYTGTWSIGKNAGSDPGGEVFQVVKNGLTGGALYRADASQQWKANGDSIFGFNVGIGTSNPISKLNVLSTGTTAISISNTSSGTSATPQLTQLNFLGYLQENRGRIEATDVSSSANGSELRFYNANTSNVLTQQMVIMPTGNVLIGTTTDAGYKLQVNGSTTSGYANQSALLVTASGTASTQNAIAIQQLTSEGDTTIFADYEPYAEYGITAKNSSDSIDFTGGTAVNYLDSYNITNRSGNARTAYVKARIGLASGVTWFGGNVGVGTTNPAAKFVISNNGAEGTEFGYSSYLSSNYFESINRSTGTPVDFSYYLGSGASHKFYTSGLERMRIVSGGNVLIGTTTDNGAKLQVNGTSSFAGDVALNGNRLYIGSIFGNTVLRPISTTNLQLFNANAGAGLFLDANGYVQIGQSNAVNWAYFSASGTTIYGTTTLSTLAGTGTRMVVSDASGILSTQSIPTGTVTGSGTTNYVSKWSSSSSLTNSLLYDDGTNVGIGTTSPSYKLDINGAARIQGNNGIYFDTTGGTANNYVGITNDYWTTLTCGRGYTSAIDLTNGNGILFRTNYSERMRIEISGNVLIGTTTDAGYKLRVNGSTYIDGTTGMYGQLYFTNFYSAGSPFDFIQSTYAGAGACGIKLTAYNPYNGTDSGLGLQVMNSSGNYVQPLFVSGRFNSVGIGETNPQAKLHIAANSLGYTQYDYSPAQNIFTYTGNSEVLEFGALRTANGSDWTSDGFRIQEKVDSTWMGYIQFNGDGNNGGLSFGTGLSSASRQSISERMRIVSGGNVLIGTTADNGAKLQVNGDAYFGSFINSTFRYSFVGSGTYNSYHTYIVNTNSSNGTYGLGVNNYNTSSDGYILGLSSAGVERMIVRNDGNVGIGTSSPQYKTTIYNGTTDTDVLCLSNPQINPDLAQHFVGLSFQDQNANGSGNVSAIRSYSNLYSYWGSILTFSTTSSASANTLLERMRIDYAGNVGIGITSLNAKFTVVGASSNTYIAIDNAASGENYYAANNLHVFQTAGAERMRIVAGGNVGISNLDPYDAL
jgi:hypothetical protein